jgi:acyl-CoA synthetase (AMP-forming)/AMP-acid ligase II
VLNALFDTIDWPTAFLGCLKAGVVAVPVNTLMTEGDYRFMLADSRARVLVVSDALYPRFEKLIGKSPDLEHVIVSGERAHGHKRFEDVLTEANAEPHAASTVRDDIAFWLYTSTTFMAGRSSASPSRTCATRWRSCSSPTGSATH